MNILPLTFKKSTFDIENSTSGQFKRLIGYREDIKKPIILSEKIIEGKNIPLEYSVKKLSNGNTFESYIVNGQKIKLIKNKFGDFLSFKTNLKGYKIDNYALVDNMKSTIYQKILSYTSPLHSLKIIK